jgi:hypothetical protein
LQEAEVLKKLALLTAVTLLSTFALGQNVSSSVTGVITDPSGAVVPGATLTITNQATTTTLTTKSDATGAFRS